MATNKALTKLNEDLKNEVQLKPIHFDSFLGLAKNKPNRVFRNIFQLFHDMMHYYIPEGTHDDLEKRGFIRYDVSKLLVENVDEPFFADRLFSNKLINLANGFKKGLQNNRIVLFEGPPGSGKSLFLSNLINKLERFTKIPEGAMYETLWRLDIKKLGNFADFHDDKFKKGRGLKDSAGYIPLPEEHLDVPCPNHDHPILQIPKAHRKQFLEDLIEDGEFKERLFNEKEYEWVFKNPACSICASIYQKLLENLKNPEQIFQMLYAQQYQFNRQLGKGVGIFNAEDPVSKKPHTNEFLQNMLSNLLKDSNAIRYIFSDFAKTNNGIYALMDIKDNNLRRLKDLYGIASDGVHKVEQIEERVNSLFIGLINPEDTEVYEDFPSFKDRITTVPMPYVLNYNTEIEVFKSKFSGDLESLFLPRVLKNFARLIVSSRLNPQSKVLKEWISNPKQYEFLDDNLLLLKIELFTDNIPTWLSEEDRKKRFEPKLRKRLNIESQFEGMQGFSGRQSIKILNNFLARYTKSGKPITMGMLELFCRQNKEFGGKVSNKFLEALVRKYDFDVLQEVKESLYYYNEDQISKDVQNYLYCINFAPGVKEKCPYTGDVIEITKGYFDSIERVLTGFTSEMGRVHFRDDTQKTYVSKTLATEIKINKKSITETEQYKFLFSQYVQNVKKYVLAPLVENDNFRRAIQDYGTGSFSAYDKRLQQDVSLLLENLQKKFGYTGEGAKQVCVYVLDKGLEKVTTNSKSRSKRGWPHIV